MQETAAKHLEDDGTFVVCFAGTDPRGEESIKEAGLHLCLRQDIVFRADLPPTITILVAKKTLLKRWMFEMPLSYEMPRKMDRGFLENTKVNGKLIKNYIHWQT